jgi:hypothetical protein
MTKDAGHKVGAGCGKPQTKAPVADKSAKKEVKTSKPEKKGK